LNKSTPAAMSPEASVATPVPLPAAPSPPPTTVPPAVPKPTKKRKDMEGAAANIFMKKSKKVNRTGSKSPMSVGNASPVHEPIRESSPLGRTSPLSDAGPLEANGRKRGREDETGPSHKVNYDQVIILDQTC
jgi:hypothetical protein